MMNHHHLITDPLQVFKAFAPDRVISLVPSWTSSLFDLGVGKALVAVTDYCIDPPEAVARIKKVGGPKTLAVDEILALKPDLVIANQEENERSQIETLVNAGLYVWLTFPKTVQAMLADLWTTASLFRSEVGMAKVQALEKTVDWAEIAAQDQDRLRTFCPIWRDQIGSGDCWWMTYNADTYPNDVLRICGGENVFADRKRRYPLLADLNQASEEDPQERDVRYPRISRQEIVRAQPEIILLPDEPFDFSEDHIQEIKAQLDQTPAVITGRIYKIDGSLLFWPGTRLARALTDLPSLLATSQ